MELLKKDTSKVNTRYIPVSEKQKVEKIAIDILKIFDPYVEINIITKIRRMKNMKK